MLVNLHDRPIRSLDHIDPYWESVPEIFDMGDDKDFLEIILDRSNGLFQFFNAVDILSTETFVNDERW